MEIWRQGNKVTRKKVDRGQRIEDRGKKEMLNHKFQITNHKQISISKFKIQNIIKVYDLGHCNL